MTLRRNLTLCLAIIAIGWLTPAAAQQPSTNPGRQILVMVNHPPDHYRPNGAYGGDYGDQLSRSSRERLAHHIASKYGLTLVNAWPMPMIGMDCFVMAVPDGRTTRDAAIEVSRDSRVQWAQPVKLYAAQAADAAPNDPLFLAEPAAQQWHLADLHRIATGRGVRIAVVDSGIDARHPDLAGQLLVNRSFVSGTTDVAERHGTGVAGIIAAKADNGQGIAGVAPDARLLGLRACWQVDGSPNSTVCDSFSLAKALYFAVQQKADVINLSLSGPDDRLLRQLLKVAQARGTTIVAAFDQRQADGGFPASVPGVIPVSDALSRPWVYIAPGHDVPTTEPGGRWFLVNGSSFAAAHVSGLVALVRQRNRSRSLTLVADSGSGAIDACATLIRVAGHCDCRCGTSREGSAR
jgi:subtilisin family serine protease